MGPVDDVRMAAVEQVMRICSDESLALMVERASTPEDVFRVVGILAEQYGVGVAPGCPLLALAGVDDLDPAWRDKIQPDERSLWAELEFYKRLGLEPAGSPVARLTACREQLGAETGVDDE